MENNNKSENNNLENVNNNGKDNDSDLYANPFSNSQEIKDIRLGFGMTQLTFAEVMGVSVKTVEAWEAGTNKPIGSARRFLSVLKADPTLLSRINIISA